MDKGCTGYPKMHKIYCLILVLGFNTKNEKLEKIYKDIKCIF